MDDKIYRRLTKKERDIIEKIEEEAKKRPHVKRYDVAFIVRHMLEGFKDWSYDEKEDALDMLEAIFDIAKKFKVMTPKQIIRERKYMMKEYINEWFEDE